MTCNFITTCFTTVCKFIWHYKKTLWINCFCNHQTICTLSTRLMSTSLSYFKAVTFCLLHFALKILFHFASKSCYISRQKLLHFGLMLHFAPKAVTFRVNVTFCVNCYILRRNIFFAFIMNNNTGCLLNNSTILLLLGSGYFHHLMVVLQKSIWC